MTLPYERTNAVLKTEKFLLSLCDPKLTPKVPKVIRDQARSLLRHYPTKFDMNEISNRKEQTEDCYKVFGIYEQV
jgi:hypothetical protein